MNRNQPSSQDNKGGATDGQWSTEFTQRLRACARMAGSGEELARLTAIPRRTLETYLSGRAEPKASRLAAIATAAKVSLDWLVTGASQSRDSVAATNADSAHVSGPAWFSVIPDTTMTAHTASDPPQPPISFDLAWLRQEFKATPQDLCAVVLGSEAMDPTLRPNNIMLIDLRRSGMDFEEGLHLLRYSDNMVIRRLQRTPDNEIILSCDNPAYKTLLMPHAEFAEKVAIVGRVVWFGRQP